MGTHFTLLGFGKESLEVVQEFNNGQSFVDLRAYWVSGEADNLLGSFFLADFLGEIKKRFDISPASSTLILIRPDGYIGFVGDVRDRAGLLEYLMPLSP